MIKIDRQNIHWRQTCNEYNGFRAYVDKLIVRVYSTQDMRGDIMNNIYPRAGYETNYWEIYDNDFEEVIGHGEHSENTIEDGKNFVIDWLENHFNNHFVISKGKRQK